MVTSFGLFAPELTIIIGEVKAFQDIELEVSRAALALYVAKLAIPLLHFYEIAALLTSQEVG